MKGKFIVIEGGDCTGKTTQVELLVKMFKGLGREIVYLDFPTYEKTPGGTTVKWYLEGKFGDLDTVPPEVGALTYSLDRYQFAKDNQKALNDGKMLIANRYTQSNIGHQGSRFKAKERLAFIDWIEKVESRMPQPDVVVYLDLPVEIAQKLKEKRGDIKGAGEKDIHEKNIQHLKDARECYLETAKRKGWIIIDCKLKDKDEIRSVKDIHREITEKLKKANFF
jgi:dTMP kinase